MKVISSEHKRKYSLITFENNKTFVVDPSLVKKYDINEGSDINMTGLLDENEEFAYTYGLDASFRILGISAKTYKEMRTKLYDRNVQTNAINRILLRLSELGYINDKTYAEDFISYKMESGYSRRAIVNKLREKGVDENIINEAIKMYDESIEFHYAEYFALKIAEKYDSLDYEKLRNKVFSRLSSKGFSTSAIYHASDKLKEKYNSAFSDRDSLMKTAARMSMRGMQKNEIYDALIKKSSSKDYSEIVTDILNELFE